MTEILLAVFASIFGLLFLCGLAVWLYMRYRLERQALLQQKLLTAAITQLTTDLEGVRMLPKFTEGLIQVSKEQVAQLTDLQEAVRKLSGLFARGDGEDFAQYDEEAADREYEIQQIQKAGISRQGAEARVSEKDMWRRMKLNG